MQWQRMTICLITVIMIAGCAQQLGKVAVYDYTAMDKDTKKVHKKVENFLQECMESAIPISVDQATRIDSIHVDKPRQKVDIFLKPINTNSFFYPG